MIVAIPKEVIPGETRVAIVPATVASLKKAGLEVWLEAGAGLSAEYADAAYQKAGATLEADLKTLYQKADLILKVRGPAEHPQFGCHEVELMRQGSVLIAMLDAYFNVETLKRLAAQRITSFAMEFIPRITRAQSMDVLSSMASLAGYRAVLTAAFEAPRYFPMLTTAAGTITPAKVFVIGAGVAGLMAIATARRLGAVVEAYDTRPVVKEQVQSLGAKFVEFDLGTQDTEDKGGYAKAQSEDFYKRQQEQMLAKVAASDIVITTAAIPGKRSPVLITEAMVQQMQPGSVIVDLAAERGGNVEGTVCNQKIIKHGVKIIGYIDHAAHMAVHASQLYGKNISTFLLNMVKEGQLHLNMADEIIAQTLVTQNGEVVHAQLKSLVAG